MYLHPDYTLQTLSDTPYLLPFGAGIASFRRPVRIDSTGAFLWDYLKKMTDLSKMTVETLAHRLAELVCMEYELQLSEMPAIQKDMSAFLENLKKHGILTENSMQNQDAKSVSGHLFSLLSISEPENKALTLSIADIKISLYGQRDFFRKELFSFEISESGAETDISNELQFYFIPEPYPHPVPEGTILINHQDLILSAFEDGYHLEQPSSSRIDRIFLKKDGSTAHFYLKGTPDDEMRYDIFHAIRLVFSYVALMRGYYLIHSVSILYREKAWLFSASSGTGKSTHAALWTRAFENEVRNLNGDLNLISVKNGIPMTYGIPWNGTSDIYTTEQVPLGGITFLRRAETDFIRELPEDGKMLSLLQRLISPNWTEELLTRQVHFAGELIPKIFMTELHCTPNPSAAVLMRQTIDHILPKEQST